MKIKKGNKALVLLASVFVTGFSLFIILKNIDFNEFLKELTNSNLLFLAASLLCFLCTYLLRSLRFRIILNSGNYVLLLCVSVLHYFINKIIPARIGEFSLPFLLRKYMHTKLIEGVNILLIVRLFDFFTVWLLFASASIILSISILPNYILYFTVPLSILIFYWLLFKGFLAIEIIVVNIKSVRKYPLGFKIISFLIRLRNLLKVYSCSLNWKRFSSVLIISILCWISTALFFYISTLSIGQNYNFGQILLATSISSLSVILPISSFGNVGTFEAGWVGAMLLVGINGADALKSAFFANLLLIVFTLVMALFAYSLLAIKYKKQS